MDPKDTQMLSGLAKLWRLQARTLAAMRVAVTYGGWNFDFDLPDDDELLYDELLDAPRGEDIKIRYNTLWPSAVDERHEAVVIPLHARLARPAWDGRADD